MTRRKGGLAWWDMGGDELHRVGRWLWTGAEAPDPEDVGSAGRQDEPTFWQVIERIADACDRQLTDAGFPPADVAIRFTDSGFWCLAEGNPGRAPSDIRVHFANNGAVYAARFAEPFTDAWFAGDLGFKCRRVLAARGSLKDQDLMEVMQIGMTLQHWEWRRGFKTSIVKWRRQNNTLGIHRETALAILSQGKDDRREAIACMLGDTKLTGGALAKYLQRRLKDEAGIATSLRSIRRDLSELSDD